MARTAAPAIGWWGAHWLQYMVEEHLQYPLTSGQVKGAERGEAVFNFGRGQISVRVEVGSYGSTETAMLKVKPLGERDWKRVVGALAEQPEAARRLLAGAPGAELGEAFAAADVPLFPPASSRSLRCTCREASSCRHVRVLVVRGAPMVDANPFLWLQVLGRSREDLLAAVRARLADRAGSEQRPPESAALSISADRFLVTETDPATIPVRPGSTAAPDALLRLLGPIPLPAEQNRFAADEVLASYLRQISSGAADLAAGDRAPAHDDEPLPGKRVPVKQRLVPEIEAAVGKSDTCLFIHDLREACPTAAALPWDAAAKALRDALAELPAEYLGLAGRYVARRSAILAGATFRHVITFPEWYSRQLNRDEDWAWTLRRAGHEGPFSIQVGKEACQADELIAHLDLQVGDELEITVADPTVPLLAGTLRRREHRSPTAPLETDREAAKLLVRFLNNDETEAIAQGDAVELLLAEGFFREGRCPDPVWLLPSPTVGNQLYWSYGGSFTAKSWRRTSMVLGGDRYEVWHDRQNTLNQFAGALLQAGLSRKEVDQALTLVEVWIRQWPGDQREARHAPTVGALLHFLWNVAPAESRRIRLAPELVPLVMGRWFRLLSGQHPGLEQVFQPHRAACDLTEAYAHRQSTLPVGRSEGAAVDVWMMEGYRWIGRQLCFRQE